MIQLFTDGACRGNPGPGGWAAIIRVDGEETELSGSDPSTTNNRMELLAVIEVISQTPDAADVEVIQGEAGDAVTKLVVRMGAAGTTSNFDTVRSYHLRSGIPLDAGTTVRVITAGDMQITVSGYTY